MRTLITGLALAVVATACSGDGEPAPTNTASSACEVLVDSFVTVRERQYGGDDEGGPSRHVLRFEGATAQLYQADTVQEGFVDCRGDDLLLLYSDAHASEGEPMASGTILETAGGPVIWFQGEAYVPLAAVGAAGVPDELSVQEMRGRVTAVVRSDDYAFAREDGWRMGPATVTLGGNQTLTVPAGTTLNGGCLDPAIPDFRDTDCYLHAFVDATGTAIRLWSGEIVDDEVRFFPPGRLGPGRVVGGVTYRFADEFTVRNHCDDLTGDPGRALAQAVATSEDVTFVLDPDSGRIVAIECQLAD
jgi:hypothetical protein